MKRYRVDIFNNGHEEHYFEMATGAIEYAREQSSTGKKVFLLEHVMDGKYDVLCQVDVTKGRR